MVIAMTKPTQEQIDAATSIVFLMRDECIEISHADDDYDTASKYFEATETILAALEAYQPQPSDDEALEALRTLPNPFVVNGEITVAEFQKLSLDWLSENYFLIRAALTRRKVDVDWGR